MLLTHEQCTITILVQPATTSVSENDGDDDDDDVHVVANRNARDWVNYQELMQYTAATRHPTPTITCKRAM